MSCQPTKQLRAGRMFEQAVLGYAGTGHLPKWRHQIHSATRSIYDAIGHKPENWNPRWPDQPLARRLYWLVARHFSKEERKSLLLFPALDRSLDLLHGVDLFFRYRDFHTVTIDLTLRKKEVSKAHILITPGILANEKELNRLTKQIARWLKNGVFLVSRGK